MSYHLRLKDRNCLKLLHYYSSENPYRHVELARKRSAKKGIVLEVISIQEIKKASSLRDDFHRGLSREYTYRRISIINLRDWRTFQDKRRALCYQISFQIGHSLYKSINTASR